MTPWSTEEVLDGQYQRVDIPVRIRTVHKGLLAEKTGRGSLLNRTTCLHDDPIGQGTELNCSRRASIYLGRGLEEGVGGYASGLRCDA